MLHTAELGLLSGGYFFGFAAMQLPLGHGLERHGPRQVLLGFLGGSVLGGLLFSLATGFAGWTRPLRCRGQCMPDGAAHRLSARLTTAAQLRANAWMMMTGSLGVVASTLPVQWLLSLAGWRPLFWGLAVLLLLSMAWMALRCRPGTARAWR